MRQRWFWISLPVVLGFIVAAVVGRMVSEPLAVQLTISVTTLIWVGGTLVSVLLVAIFAVFVWQRQRTQSVGVHTQDAGERGRFLRRLDHEMKNPLTAIRIGLANLKDAPLNETQRDALDSIEHQVLRVGRLVADLRELAEFETCPLEQAPVDVVGLLQDAITLAKEHTDFASRRISLAVSDSVPRVLGDRDLLLMAIYNLIDNALKFTRPEDGVDVRVFESDALVTVEVAETGPGILAADLPHIWKELYRGSDAHGIPGSGLGLPLVGVIVARHGGQVSAHSETGQGTVFTISLPLRDVTESSV